MEQKLGAKANGESLWRRFVGFLGRNKPATKATPKIHTLSKASTPTPAPPLGRTLLPFRKCEPRPHPHAREFKWQDGARRLEEAHPDLWKAAYPRVYRNTGIYHSPRELACAITAILALQKKSMDLKAEETNALISAAKLVQLQVPIFFVSPAL